MVQLFGIQETEIVIENTKFQEGYIGTRRRQNLNIEPY